MLVCVRVSARVCMLVRVCMPTYARAHPWLRCLPAPQTFFALFTGMAIAWSVYVWKEQAQAHRVHLVMAALVYFKAFTLMSQVRVCVCRHSYGSACVPPFPLLSSLATPLPPQPHALHPCCAPTPTTSHPTPRRFPPAPAAGQAGMNHYIERTGHADGWNIAYYFFTFCRGTLFFTVVVLIGTGWSYMVRHGGLATS